MSADYIITRLPEAETAPALEGVFTPESLNASWAAVPEAKLAFWPWQKEYCPECAARVGWNSQGIHVVMYANEPEIRAVETEIGGEVCLDSCLEFFLAPDADKPAYVNCECNPNAVMHIGVGTGRYNRTVFREIPPFFAPSHSVHEGGWWAISYTIPAVFIKAVFGAELRPGGKMRGNFYTCGDKTRHIHYGMFRPYDLPAADFHRPELFASFELR